ncbi:MAG: hypothetical protein EOP04_22315 [Proteobacteria bacterium]|nr:MAG: hypothetical protein EOP04_22315 [Pseudomonadota bacterium]
MRPSESSAPAGPPLASETSTPDDADLDVPEVTDFSHSVRGKYYERITGRPLPIELDEDVRAVFPDAVAVNEALRTLIRLQQTRAA